MVMDEKVYDLSFLGEDYDEAFFGYGGLIRLKSYIGANCNKLKRLDDHATLIALVARPSKVLCVGLNYADHAKETKADPPREPVLFMKSTTALKYKNLT